MNEIIDLAVRNYEFADRLNDLQLAVSRERMAQYIGKLISAGQDDPLKLAEYARAYLRELSEGPDPRFSGC